MERAEALQEIRKMGRPDFDDRTKDAKLSPERADLLFKFVKGDLKIESPALIDIEEFALKSLLPEVYKKLPHDGHPYSNGGENYEYDPSKNGKNIIKHGLGFAEVASYSNRLGSLLVRVSHDAENRYVLFSDLNLDGMKREMALPPPRIRELNYVISIVYLAESGRFRFISSRILSSSPRKYRDTMRQAFGNLFSDEDKREEFIDYCVEYVETYLFSTPGNSSAS